MSKIHKGRNKIVKDLDEFYLPKSKELKIMVKKIAARCETIKQTMQYAEFMFQGTNAEVIFSLDEPFKRLEILAEGDDDDEKLNVASLNTKMTNIALKITEPLKLLLGNAQSFSNEIDRKCASSQDDNSSDFVCLSDKSTQTLEIDCEKCYTCMYKIPRKGIIKSKSKLDGI